VGLTRVPVVVERGRDVWRLVYAEPCVVLKLAMDAIRAGDIARPVYNVPPAVDAHLPPAGASRQRMIGPLDGAAHSLSRRRAAAGDRLGSTH
jgi:hypothetical protein